MNPNALAPAVLAALAQVPVGSLAEARRFLRLAFRMIRDAPLGDGTTAGELIASRPVLAEGLSAVDWYLLLGRWPVGEGLWRDVLRAADLVGPFERGVTGVAAAAWGVFHVVTAAETLAEAGQDPEALGGAAAHATLAADLAARSAEGGYSEEAVRFLAAVAAGTFGLHISPPPGCGAD